MAWLLIDNSNTRTKFRLGDQEGLSGTTRVCQTEDIADEKLSEVLEGFHFTHVAIASVVPDKAALLQGYFQGKEVKLHEISYKSPLGYEFGVERSDQIGADRLVNAVALMETGRFPSVVVDFGTAVTFSVLSAEKTFLGGVIAPGMGLMAASLSRDTAQLPRISLDWSGQVLGHTTVQAIQTGVAVGQRGMVREVLNAISQEIEQRPYVVATGGGARFVAEEMDEFDAVDEDFTLEGIRLVAARVFQ